MIPYEKSLSQIAGGFLRLITLTVLPLFEHRTLGEWKFAVTACHFRLKIEGQMMLYEAEGCHSMLVHQEILSAISRKSIGIFDKVAQMLTVWLCMYVYL